VSYSEHKYTIFLPEVAMLDEMLQRELDRAIDEHVSNLLNAVGMTQPPVDAVQIAAACNCTVAIDRRQHNRGRCVRLPGGAAATIVVRPEPRHERTQWSVAHELGESHLGQLLRAAAMDERELTSCQREWIANRFANRLLLPTDWFMHAGQRCAWDLFQLKTLFTTASHELIARRNLDAPTSILITVIDHGQIHWRSGNQPNVPRGLLPDERTAWQQAHQSGRVVNVDGQWGQVRAWPVHETGWRREIVRVDLESIFDDEAMFDESETSTARVLSFRADVAELTEQRFCRIGFANELFDAQAAG
jgi:hypothetical protein